MATTVKMNFEGLAYYGVKGSSAGTNLTNCRDITYNLTAEYGDTTVRGDSTVPPMETSSVTRRIASIEITMLYDTSDTSYTAMETAAAAGTAVAWKTKSYSSGKGFDGDVVLEMSRPFPLAGEQVVTFTGRPNRDDRAPSFNTT